MSMKRVLFKFVQNCLLIIVLIFIRELLYELLGRTPVPKHVDFCVS